jgi:hypothetical protein
MGISRRGFLLTGLAVAIGATLAKIPKLKADNDVDSIIRSGGWESTDNEEYTNIITLGEIDTNDKPYYVAAGTITFNDNLITDDDWYFDWSKT